MIDPYPLTDLVLAIESQNTNKQEVIIRHTIQSLQSETDVVILGCTHFPIIRSIIYQYTNLPLIDPGYEAAQQLVHYFDRHSDYMISTQHPHISYTVTGNPNQFAHSMQQIFDIESEVSRREI
ncbi:MAG: aspartate/glutamate racemase family protein [Candidatus Peribacteria bacterium]|nr:MAG: aspartate/glutamate racemase family protein [Candidatus Peribacteria bacterium]